MREPKRGQIWQLDVCAWMRRERLHLHLGEGSHCLTGAPVDVLLDLETGEVRQRFLHVLRAEERRRNMEHWTLREDLEGGALEGRERDAWEVVRRHA